jgi:hypothetical protein
MNMVIPNEGKLLLLAWAIRDDTLFVGGYIVGLYSNNYTPVNSSVLADFTTASFTGYSVVPLARLDFAPPVILSNVAYITSSVTPIYDCTGGAPETIYGWFMADASLTHVIAAQRFDVPRVMSTGTEEALDPFRIALKTFT